MVNKFVIDTNVAISANGKGTHASQSCQLKCIEFLSTCKQIHISIDQSGLMMEEYAKHLSYAGQPGVGDIFFKYLHDHQHCGQKVHRVAIKKSNDMNKGFDELPVNSLDPSDRKFLATSVVAKATIVNATDSDWKENSELLEALQVELKQLCPEHSYK